MLPLEIMALSERATSPNAPARVAGAAVLLTVLGLATALPAAARSKPDAESAASSGRRSGGLEALDVAFRFASAIETDPKDRSMAQQAVVEDYVALGELDEAAGRSAGIAGWRRGIAYAEIASALARSGRSRVAETMIEKAEQVRRATVGWQNPRIAAHVAEALGRLGEVERSRDVVVGLAASDGQYSGASVATIASALAARGEFGAALAELGKAGETTDFDVIWWRTEAYLDLVRRERGTRPERLRALEEARRSAAGIPGWQRAQALEAVAEAALELGQRRAAKESLSHAEALLANVGGSVTPLKPAVLAQLARSWGRAGERARARKLLMRAAEAVPEVQVIEQPAAMAAVAEGYSAIGRLARAWSLYEGALASAESLQNSRPRALAVVSICRSIGRAGLSLNGARRSRLNGLLGGLGDPW